MDLRKRRSIPRTGIVLIAAVAVGLFSLCSCAALDSGLKSFREVSPEKKTEGSPVFRSEDYVVCRLEGGESAFTLAERFLGDRNRAWVIEEANPGLVFEKDRVAVIPLRDENKGGLTAEGYKIVPILCYHDFAENCRSSLCMPKALFEQQMRYLKENGYRVISMAELLAFLNYRSAVPEKSVVITIDDGYRSSYEIAYPILKKYGFAATLFVYTDFVGISGTALTWDQLREMKASGFEVGSHTLSHCDLTKIGPGEGIEAYSARVQRELLLSKKIIDEKLDQETISLAFPYGEYNHRILHLSEKVGYKVGASVKNGGNPFFSDPLALKREQILEKDMGSFVSKLKTFHELTLR